MLQLAECVLDKNLKIASILGQAFSWRSIGTADIQVVQPISLVALLSRLCIAPVLEML